MSIQKPLNERSFITCKTLKFSLFQVVILAALVAVANAGFLGAPAAVGYAAAPAYGYAAAAPAYGYAAHSLATPAITAQHSNILRTPGNLGQISTYSKSINTPYSSVSKSDVRVSNDALAYPAVAHAPVAYAAHAPVAYAAHGPVAYAAPAVHAAPAVAYGAPAVHAAPAIVKAAAPAVVGHSLIGVAYSAAPAVAHMTYSNGLGLSYAW
ncbi:cuticle protein 76-like [Anabrus simplex]|uniref:cuticle protein 76-like n=1 Tax=Anabrus simplex TaxID=316456 RepID=UPI0035A2F51E